MARILVVDDNDNFRKALEEMLERAGYEVYSASGAQEGIDAYKENPMDLIIVDMIMPKKTGVDVLRELQTNFPHLKAFLISGSEMPDETICADIPSIKYLFPKPLDMKEFLQAVKEIVG